MYLHAQMIFDLTSCCWLMCVCLLCVQTWNAVSGRTIKFMNIDVAKEYDLLLRTLEVQL